MNNNTITINWAILTVCIYASMLLGSAIGSRFVSNSILSSYCESQSAQYEGTDGVDYCLKDNQLTVIEWME